MEYSRNITLTQCALVCRAWVPRAQMHLFYSMHAIKLDRNNLECLGFTITHKHFLIQNIQHITLEGQNLCSGEATIFLLGLDKPRLWGCTIRSLSRRNNAIFSVPLGRYAFNSLKDIVGRISSIRKLALLDCGIRDAQILADFLNHFRSLSILLISWDSKTKFIQQNHPHPARPRHSDCSLLSLAIEIVPNISTLLSFFIETRPLVNNLKYLMVACSFSNLIVLLQEIDELLLHCSHSIQELSIVVGHFLEQNYAQDAGISSSIK